jgi:hypothetical protein|tara:strand:- start:365 stop:532 length:168 start_codon:yes stop_codon:yes gene_type:complete
MYKVILIKDRHPRKKGDYITTDQEGKDNLLAGGFIKDETKTTKKETGTKTENKSE